MRMQAFHLLYNLHHRDADRSIDIKNLEDVI